MCLCLEVLFPVATVRYIMVTPVLQGVCQPVQWYFDRVTDSMLMPDPYCVFQLYELLLFVTVQCTQRVR